MCPGKMMSNMPIASVAVIESSVISSDRFRESRNFGSTTPKNKHIPSNAKAME
jgi:hypothetical protein